MGVPSCGVLLVALCSPPTGSELSDQDGIVEWRRTAKRATFAATDPHVAACRGHTGPALAEVSLIRQENRAQQRPVTSA